MRTGSVFLGAALALALAACDREAPPPPPERIRAVKTIVITERASGQTRSFPGVVEPVDTSNVSFEVSGLVKSVGVDAGDEVEAGQVLAVLDRTPFDLNVEAAKANLSGAKAHLEEKKAAYDRQRSMLAQDVGATSRQAVEQARAAFESLRENVTYIQAQLDLARLDLERTELRSPYQGMVARRNVEPFEEVRRGQPVLELFAKGAMQVAVQVPENLIDAVRIGQPAKLQFPTLGDQTFEGAVTEVGSTAQSANAFPVKATIGSADARVRPGITATVSLLIASESSEDAYLVPVSALAPGNGESQWNVFVFDPATSTVRLTAVANRGVVGNRAALTSGVSPGDVVVVAGVSFLSDGQNVKLMQPAPAATGG